MNIPNRYYLLLTLFLLFTDLFDSYFLDQETLQLKKLFVRKSFSSLLLLFIILVIPLTYIDYYKVYPFYFYKVEKDRNNLTFDLLFKTFKLVIFNLLLVPLVSYLFYPFILLNQELNLYEIFYLIPFLIMEEIVFYWSHRILHLPYFYKNIHKIHHEWVYPIALSCIYSHPLEFIFSNLSPTIITLLISSYLNISISIYFYWFWMYLGFTNTIITHSGYSMKQQYDLHFYHHISFNYNYGTSLFMDKLMKTDKTINRNDIKKFV